MNWNKGHVAISKIMLGLYVLGLIQYLILALTSLFWGWMQLDRVAILTQLIFPFFPSVIVIKQLLVWSSYRGDSPLGPSAWALIHAFGFAISLVILWFVLRGVEKSKPLFTGVTWLVAVYHFVAVGIAVFLWTVFRLV